MKNKNYKKKHTKNATYNQVYILKAERKRRSHLTICHVSVLYLQIRLSIHSIPVKNSLCLLLQVLGTVVKEVEFLPSWSSHSINDVLYLFLMNWYKNFLEP